MRAQNNFLKKILQIYTLYFSFNIFYIIKNGNIFHLNNLIIDSGALKNWAKKKKST